MRRNAKDLSLPERQEIHKMHENNYGIREIGRKLKRAASTICRELKRAANGNMNFDIFAWYDKAKLSHDKSRSRRKKKRNRIPILKNPIVSSYVYGKLKQKWSPEVISARIGIELPGEFISHETIYQYIYKYDRSLVQYLTKKGKSRRYTGNGKSRPLRGKVRHRKAGKEAKRPIGSRPEAANNRSELGHLETDLIVSPPKKGKSALQVTVDRQDRRVILSLLPNRQADEARKSLLQRLLKLEPEERRTLTADNGSEHADLPELEKIISDIQTYYCGPYRSWERGTVEATNGIIRRWFPKGTNFDNVTQEQVQEVEHWFNNRPMLIHGGRTPNEMHAAQLAKEIGQRPDKQQLRYATWSHKCIYDNELWRG